MSFKVIIVGSAAKNFGIFVKSNGTVDVPKVYNNMSELEVYCMSNIVSADLLVYLDTSSEEVQLTTDLLSLKSIYQKNGQFFEVPRSLILIKDVDKLISAQKKELVAKTSEAVKRLTTYEVSCQLLDSFDFQSMYESLLGFSSVDIISAKTAGLYKRKKGSKALAQLTPSETSDEIVTLKPLEKIEEDSKLQNLLSTSLPTNLVVLESEELKTFSSPELDTFVLPDKPNPIYVFTGVPKCGATTFMVNMVCSLSSVPDFDKKILILSLSKRNSIHILESSLKEYTNIGISEFLLKEFFDNITYYRVEEKDCYSILIYLKEHLCNVFDYIFIDIDFDSYKKLFTDIFLSVEYHSFVFTSYSISDVEYLSENLDEIRGTSITYCLKLFEAYTKQYFPLKVEVLKEYLELDNSRFYNNEQLEFFSTSVEFYDFIRPN